MGLQGLKVRDNVTGEEELCLSRRRIRTIGHTPNTNFLGGQVEQMSKATSL